MKEQRAIQFFVGQTLLHARSLPIVDARAFLKGLLLLTEDSSETQQLRKTYEDVCTLDDSMEALQLKFELKLPAGKEGG